MGAGDDSERQREGGRARGNAEGAGRDGNLLVNTGGWGDAHAAPHAPARGDDDDDGAPCCGVAAAVLE